MRTQINELLEKVRTLEGELEIQLAERRRSYGYKLEQGRLFITREARERQAALKVGLRHYLIDSGVLTILTAPFIYAVAIPVFALDVVASLYQAVCFRVYGVDQVKRRAYVVFDRHRLPYLNLIQKVNCFYCAYANGVIAYVHEIASRTEQYWCPIKHAERLAGTHRRYDGFLEYGDVGEYPQSLEEQRRRLRDEGDLPPDPEGPQS
ncbi:hypothetical protein [uncultured Maricaulis sp.]|uniref:hypothetical protein n=1 Tax=uncultured Maricaulis sp. TaxID=174710 RepID=UPI0030DAEE8C|tara:strand:+ start:62943 stop:63563 length:621 start_codon:yes stop_codon:yes gene_type:complete